MVYSLEPSTHWLIETEEGPCSDFPLVKQGEPKLSFPFVLLCLNSHLRCPDCSGREAGNARATCYLKHVCASLGLAVFSVLFDRAISEPSQNQLIKLGTLDCSWPA